LRIANREYLGDKICLWRAFRPQTSGIFSAWYDVRSLTFTRRATNMNNTDQTEQFSQTESPEVSGNNLSARPRRILVVDDEPAARVLAFRVFSEAGFEVTTAQSGFECLEHFRKRPNWFDLILLDLSMPFMDGEETFRHLRALNPNVVTILSTGFLAQAQERIDRMLAGGLAGSIRKPHQPDELLALVNATLERVKFSRVGAAANLAASTWRQRNCELRFAICDLRL
jgi:CheY-like chemotaxis protein